MYCEFQGEGWGALDSCCHQHSNGTCPYYKNHTEYLCSLEGAPKKVQISEDLQELLRLINKWLEEEKEMRSKFENVVTAEDKYDLRMALSQRRLHILKLIALRVLDIDADEYFDD